MSKAPQHFVLLDAMRGVAALTVLWGHLADAWHHPGGQDYILAVDFFFILSGFVIAHAYQRKLTTDLSVFAFYRTRVIRLYPLLMVGAFIGGMSLLVIHADEPAWSVGNIVATTMLAALALPSFLLPTDAAFPANGPAWSLFFELIANFAYAPLARLLTRNRLVVLTALAAVLLAINTMQRGTIESGWSRHELVGGLIRVFFGFTCGLMLYHVRPAWKLGQRWGVALASARVSREFPWGTLVVNVVGSLLAGLLVPTGLAHALVVWTCSFNTSSLVRARPCFFASRCARRIA